MEIKESWIKQAKVDSQTYEIKYKNSLEDNDNFWKEEGKRLDWVNNYTKIKDVKYSKNEVDIKWYYDGSLNVSYNCIDRHAKNNPDGIAIIWEGDDPNNVKKISYQELLVNVSKAANVLKKIGVKKGDRVTIYLTMIPELAYMMLACARIGAVHSIIFGGFSAESISGRILDCKSEFVITADEGVRGGKNIPLKNITDTALESCPNVKKISYQELLVNVSKAANVLKKIGVKKGDRVTIYLTMIPELAYMMLACSRIGAVHSIIFGGFSAESISGRILDCKSEFVITADEGVRGGKNIPLKNITDEALESCPDVKKCLVVK